MSTNEAKEIIKELERLRLARKDFSESIDQQERELLRRLNHSYPQGAEPPISPTIAVGISRSVEVKSEGKVHLRRTNSGPVEYRPIASNSELQPGDRIRITNSLRHISGPVAEENRLGVVTKVNKVFVQVTTDSGHSVNRIKSNLQKATVPRIAP